jgi:hypothetical protein
MTYLAEMLLEAAARVNADEISPQFFRRAFGAAAELNTDHRQLQL